MFKFAALPVWGLALIAGFGTLGIYQFRPGAAAAAPVIWPADSKVRPVWGMHHLVVFLHPKCPCSRATLTQLQQIVERAPTALAVTVLFIRPAGAGEGWEQTDLWRQASNIPGAQLLIDPDRIETRRFGAATSGQVLLFNPAGRQIFAGGITPTRGHEGANAGQEAIVALLRSDMKAAATSPVFGCPLFEESSNSPIGASACRN